MVSLRTDKTKALIFLDDLGRTKLVLSKIIELGKPVSAILYSMSKDSLSASDINVSVVKSIHPFHAFNVGLPTMALTATSLPKPNDRAMDSLSIEVYRVN